MLFFRTPTVQLMNIFAFHKYLKLLIYIIDFFISTILHTIFLSLYLICFRLYLAKIF